MIRPAKFVDTPEIQTMLREMLPLSKYAGRVEISDKALDAVVMGLVAGQKQNGPQATFCSIAQEGGKIVGFMAGVLDRIYHIGTKLTAGDAYLYVREGAAMKHSIGLIDAYIAWASANPKVIEITLSWHDALPGAARIAPLYQRKGFSACGERYEMRLDLARQEAA